MKNTFVKVLSFVMALMMVVGTFSTLSVFAADECAHTNRTAGDVVAPTCTTFGYTTYTCDDCGEEFHDNVVAIDKDAHPADKIKTLDAIEADCLNNARSAGKECEQCGEVLEGKETTENTMTKHVIVGTYVEATCSEYGYYTYGCSECGYSVAEILAKKGEDKKDLTFREDQAIELESYKENRKNTEDKPYNPDHSETKYLVWTIKDATECEKGSAVWGCPDCDYKKVDKELPATHVYSMPVNPNGATCCEWAQGTMACPKCGEIEPNATKNPGYNAEHAKTGEYTPITTQTNGYKIAANDLPQYTNAYGEKVNFTLAEIKELLGLDIGDVLKKDANCVEAGYQWVQCNCGAFKRLDTEKTEHNLSYTIVYPTNCTEQTIQLGECKTSVDGKDICDYEETVVLNEAAAAAHDYKVTVKAPGCTTIGYTTKVCQNSFVSAEFGLVKCSEYDEKLAEWLAADENKDETPDNKARHGNEDYTGVNGGNLTIDYKDAAGHTWGETYWVSGTCTTADDETNTDNVLHMAHECEVCATIEAVTTGIPNACVAGAKITVPASCVNRVYTCTPCVVCGNELNKNEDTTTDVDKTAHVYPTIADFAGKYTVIALDTTSDKVAERINVTVNADWFKGWNKVPTCDSEGEAIVKCLNCNTCKSTATKLVAAPAIDHLLAGAYIGEFKDDNDNVYQAAVFDNKDADGYCETNHIHSPETCKGSENYDHDDSEVPFLAANCQEVGYMDDGAICVMCLKGTAPTVIEKDPYNHKGVNVTVTSETASIAYTDEKKNTSSLDVLEYHPATCISAAYVVFNSKCCGYTRQYIGKKADVHTWKVEEYKEATCYKPGNHSYRYCEACKIVEAASIHTNKATTDCGCGLTGKAEEALIASNNPVIMTLKHDWVDIKAVAATCPDPDNGVTGVGYKAYKWCGNCHDILFENKIYDVDQYVSVDATQDGTTKVWTVNDVSYGTATTSPEKALKAAIEISAHADSSKKTVAATRGKCGEFGVTPNVYKLIKWEDKNSDGKMTADECTFATEVKDGATVNQVLYTGTSTVKYCPICGVADPDNGKALADWIDVIYTVDGEGEKVYAADAAHTTATGDGWAKVVEYYIRDEDLEVSAGVKISKDVLKKYYDTFLAQYEAGSAHEPLTTGKIEKKGNEKITFINCDGAEFDTTTGKLVVSNVWDCTLKSFAIVECENPVCKYVYAYTYEDLYTAHAWDGLLEDAEAKPAEGKPACLADWYKTIKCDHCSRTDEKKVSGAIGHYIEEFNGTTTEKVFFDLDCDTYKDWADVECAACGYTMNKLAGLIKDKKASELEKELFVDMIHDNVTTKVDATCEQAGYIIETCRVCKNVVNEPIDMLGDPNDGKHSVPNGNYLIYIAPTVTTEGYAKYICADCGETIEETLTAANLFDTVVVPEYETYAAGNTIKATVSVSGSAFDFNTIHIDVDLTKAGSLKLVDVELISTFGGASVDVAIVKGNIEIFVLDSVKGDKLNATFEGGENVELLTLTFTTNKMATGKNLYIETKAINSMFWNAENDEGKEAETTNLEDALETKPATFAILTVGDVNGDKDSKIDASDIQAFLPALSATALTGEYIAKFDLNNDGAVDFNDVAGLRAYVADPDSLYTYFEMIGEDVDAVLDASIAPQIVVNYAQITSLIAKAEAYKKAFDADAAADKALSAATNDGSEAYKALEKAAEDAQKALDALAADAGAAEKLEETDVIYVDDASDRKALFTAAMNAIFAELNADGYKKLCAQYEVDNLTDLVAQIVKTATQELYANPYAADLLGRDIIFTADCVYIDIDVDGDIDVIEY